MWSHYKKAPLVTFGFREAEGSKVSICESIHVPALKYEAHVKCLSAGQIVSVVGLQ